jgi:selenide, water dikinase
MADNPTEIPDSNDISEIKLTAYSRGAGCGCKISPQQLEEILRTSPDNSNKLYTQSLLVGNNTNDDAAVIDMGNGMALISTTDFFMPVIDDAYEFGRIASANAISDVYAMGGKPIMAVAILGWPVDKIPALLASRVLDGARDICSEARIPLAGGHSIDSAEPIFGLAVSGTVHIENLKKNNTAKEGNAIFLTKAIGSGILSTTQKRGLLKEEDYRTLLAMMTKLNVLGETLGGIRGVTAMTDVTGFGLLGHLIEMMESSGNSAELFYPKLAIANGVKEYLAQRMVPDATYRNWNSYSTKVSFEKGINVMEAFNILPDPQTNGGLLFTVEKAIIPDIQKLLKENGLEDFSEPVGTVVAKSEKTIIVKN